MSWNDTNIFQGMRSSFTKWKIQRYQRQLGNGHDADLHIMIAELYKHLDERQLALQSYRAAAQNLVQHRTPLKATESDRLIWIYKHMLEYLPYNVDIAAELSREYQRRGMDYRSISLHLSLAKHYREQHKYGIALQQYQQIIQIESGSLSARERCAELHCRLGNPVKAAEELTCIGDLYFDHQKFEGALTYYQRAAELAPEDEEVAQKAQVTQRILEGHLIPQAQASLQKLSNMNQQNTALRRSLEEKQQIEQELRQNIELLKQRYDQSVSSKNQQLQATQKRLDELATYVAVFKDNLEQVSTETERLRRQLAEEMTHKKALQQKLHALNRVRITASEGGHTVDVQPPDESAGRLEHAMTRLQQEQQRLVKQVQTKLDKTIEREHQLRDSLELHTTQGATLEQRLQAMAQKHEDVKQQLHQQLRKNLEREQGLQQQMKTLITEHEQALKHVQQERYRLAERCRTTQAQMSVAEEKNMDTLKQLHQELSRQCQAECSFSEKFHTSVQEIADLLHDQERQIQELTCL